MCHIPLSVYFRYLQILDDPLSSYQYIRRKGIKGVTSLSCVIYTCQPRVSDLHYRICTPQKEIYCYYFWYIWAWFLIWNCCDFSLTLSTSPTRYSYRLWQSVSLTWLSAYEMSGKVVVLTFSIAFALVIQVLIVRVHFTTCFHRFVSVSLSAECSIFSGYQTWHDMNMHLYTIYNLVYIFTYFKIQMYADALNCRDMHTRMYVY